MYLQTFHLREYPFQLTPDSDFLYMSKAHARAKAYMDYTIWNRDGFVAITGDVGTGKTTLIQKFLSEIDENVLVAKIFQTQLNENEFLQAVLIEFGLKPPSLNKVELLDTLNSFLISSFMKSRQLVLIVDEAQNLSLKVLEEIRMLSGLETRKEKILHVILVGQPELKEKLESPELEQLVQRIRLQFHLRGLSEVETKEYIKHRLHIAGATNENLFTADAFPVIYRYTGGIPRLINTLCDTALTCAHTDGISVVSATVIKTAIDELQWLAYADRLKAQSKRRSSAPSRDQELPQILREQSQALTSLSAKLARLDALPGALGVISNRMASLEVQLRRIADQFEDVDNVSAVKYVGKLNK
jgi:putative secretion ATPase (PEP-CTERM system associated)